MVIVVIETKYRKKKKQRVTAMRNIKKQELYFSLGKIKDKMIRFILTWCFLICDLNLEHLCQEPKLFMTHIR